MEFFQEPFFTASVALIITFLVAKIISFAVSRPPRNDSLRLRSSKGQKRVKFLDEVMIRMIDRYEDCDNLETWGDGFGGVLEDSGEEKIGAEEDSGMIETEDEDWEGVERSELEKVFAEVVNYVEEYGGNEKLSGDVQMELYGLHKVAVEGPCFTPQPMPLKISARAKWNAWQRLGTMNQEAAMEQYIRVFSDNYSADDISKRCLETVGGISAADNTRNSEPSSSPVRDSTDSRSSTER